MTSPYQPPTTRTAAGWLGPLPDTSTPAASRMCDYLLGGQANLPVDRAAADRLLSVLPTAGLDANANRTFVRRAIRHLQTSGVRQFLSLGAGLPTFGGVHQLVTS